MNSDILWGVLVGSVGMGALIYLGAIVMRYVSRHDREQEIQSRLTRALAKIRDNEIMLEREILHSDKVESDFKAMKLVCGKTIENTIVYFEQNPAIWGEKGRAQIVDELYSALEYTGRERKPPVALLEHFNGGDNEQPSYT